MSDFPAKIQEIVNSALQKNADERYQTADEFGQEIKDLLYDIEHEISIEKMSSSSRISTKRKSDNNPSDTADAISTDIHHQ